MPFESTQKGMQRGGYRCPYSQTAAFRVFPEKFYGSWRKLQSDRYCGLGNFDGSIELGRFLEIAICLTLG
jgi:hypothetical protein